jgi:predicted flap endonuclease-1-like 5' DNA nuclease
MLVVVICLAYVAALLWTALGKGESTPKAKPMPLNVASQKRTMAPVASSRPTKTVAQPAAVTPPQLAPTVASVAQPSPILSEPDPVLTEPAAEATLIVDTDAPPTPSVESPVEIVEERAIMVDTVVEEEVFDDEVFDDEVSENEFTQEKVTAVTRTADDFKRIEGIGPKIAGVLTGAGITTFSQLAQMDADQIRAVLAGQVRIFNPDSWPAQAKLAAAGQWDELALMQSQLKAERRA